MAEFDAAHEEMQALVLQESPGSRGQEARANAPRRGLESARAPGIAYASRSSAPTAARSRNSGSSRPIPASGIRAEWAGTLDASPQRYSLIQTGGGSSCSGIRGHSSTQPQQHGRNPQGDGGMAGGMVNAYEALACDRYAAAGSRDGVATAGGVDSAGVAPRGSAGVGRGNGRAVAVSRGAAAEGGMTQRAAPAHGAMALAATRQQQQQQQQQTAAGRGTAAMGDERSKHPGRVNAGWTSGPIDPAGTLVDLSDRPSSCSAADWPRGEVVIGSTDHALYVIDVNTGSKKRTLYTKACGHTEWVTCVAMLPQGQVVSGGMDSRLWLWPCGGTRGSELTGHSGAVSQVAYSACDDVVASCSYDRSVRLWSVGASRGAAAATLSGHDAPVLEMDIGGDGRIVTGDRSGHVMLWDVSSGSSGWRLKSIHSGHVTSLAWWDAGDGSALGGCFVSGGQDGVVRVWDPRDCSNVAQLPLHVNMKGRGAVGDILAGGGAVCGMLVTAGADGTVQILDPRSSFATTATIRLPDFPYSMSAAGGLALVGCGNGTLHVIDVMRGKTLYALGTTRGAVRTMQASAERLVVSGDDGNAVLYSFA
ncbi:MAG: hypothetical protein WDW36_005146 [Sanguina aurantia]